MQAPSPNIESTVQLVFEGSDATFSFSSPSTEQPSMVLEIVETCSSDINSEAKDSAGAQVPDIRVYRAVVQSSEPGTVHIAPTIGTDVAVKIVAGKLALGKLHREAATYQKLLHPLQGTVVPRFHGEFLATIESGKFGCLVMEWCEAPPTQMRNMPEIARREILAICRLHRLGIEHGGLDFRGHALMATDGSVRLVSFSRAQVHKCEGAYPLLYQEKPGEIRGSCKELLETENRLGRRCGCLSLTRLPEGNPGSLRCERT